MLRSHILRQALILLLGLVSLGLTPGHAATPKRDKEEKVQRKLREEYRALLDYATGQVAQMIQKRIAPESGRELSGEALLTPIYTNDAQGWVACDITVTFLARDILSGVPYGTCRAQGRLFLYAPRYEGENHKVEYVHTAHNEQLAQVSSESALRWLTEGFTTRLK